MTKIPISSLLMKTLVKALLISLMAAMPVPVIAQSDDVLEMSIDDNIATPEVPRKAKQYVAAAMDQLRRHMIKNKYTVESLRDGEVIEITIPCAELFAPGEVELKANAAELLRRKNIRCLWLSTPTTRATICIAILYQLRVPMQSMTACGR